MADTTTKSASLPDDKIEVVNNTRGTNIDPEAERKLLRKCDIRVLPPLFVLFLLAFLDRVNIGTSHAMLYSISDTNKYRQCKNTRLA
jgi:hypothetical protein